VVVIERDLRPPQTFVGELLQPGGVHALEALDLLGCLRGIDAQPTRGFAVTFEGQTHRLDYPAALPKSAVQQLMRDPKRTLTNKQLLAGRADGAPPRRPRGFAFHHGRFVDALRQAARDCSAVTVQQGTVCSLHEERGRVRGVRYRDQQGTEHTLSAHVVIATDGRNSKLRRELGSAEPHRVSYAVGVLVRGCELAAPGYGNVFVAEPAPLLGYRIDSGEVRILVDVPGDLPNTRNGALDEHLRRVVAPQLPNCLRQSFIDALSEQRLRAMPNYALAPRPQQRAGAVMLGDALNMRHPLTGSGMTVALSDARLLLDLFSEVSFAEAREIDKRTARFYRQRRALSLTVDMLAGALYEVFKAQEPGLERMREAMLRYWQLGGAAAEGPISLLSGLAPRPSMMLMHYLAVAMLGVGTQLKPRGYRPSELPANIKSASELLVSAYGAIRGQLPRVWSR